MILRAKCTQCSGFQRAQQDQKNSSLKDLMATVFWNSEGIILVNFLEGSKTITGICNEGVLRKFKAAVIKKKVGKVAQGHLVPSW